MFTVKFDDIDSREDWGIYLSTKEIGYPTVKTEIADAPGIDGVVDLTEALSNKPHYGNRTITLTFLMLDNRVAWQGILDEIAEALHGQKVKIIGSWDPDFYYYGRCSLDPFKSDRLSGTIVIKCDCEPYKYSTLDTNDRWKWDPFNFLTGIIQYIGEITIEGSGTVDMAGSTVAYPPVFFVTSASTGATVTKSGVTYPLQVGRNRFPDLIVGPNGARLEFVGDITLTIEFREKRL